MPGLLILETSLLLFSTLRREPTFRATKANSSSQALLCRNFTTSEASEELCQCQTAGDRLRGGTSLVRTDTHTLTNTHSASHTLWAWETWVQREQLDCTVLLTELFLWATCQVGFEGQDECLYCPPGLLSTLPKGNCPLSSLMSMASPYSAAPHTMASWRSKQERQPDSSLLREKQSPLTPLTLLWKPKGWLFCYSSPAQRTNCIRTLV